MRFVRMCLIAIVLMVPCRLVHADTQAVCAIIAADFASSNVTDIDMWITMYRQTYAVCLSRHGVNSEASVPAKELEETGTVAPGHEMTESKSVNKKAVFKSAKAKSAIVPAVITGKKSPPEIARIEKQLSKPKHEPIKSVTPKPAKKIVILPAKNPSTISVGKLAGAPKKYMPDPGAESWRINCSPRFGGFNKASEYFISSSGKRLSCLMGGQP